ncbi:MAG: serine hydrolase [Candidatus Omnitrophica bacterium]|jgi:D-alanyl-D-alanine carboxypeptidase|nr:serine hydrolase [Candidatus Omnitrophota bacterium]
MKKIIFFALIFICSIPLCLAENLTQDKTIKVEVGQNFTITLEANATTGYEWQFAKPLDENSFKLISSEYVADETNRIGAGGRQIWILKALKAGETVISFKYVRPWEKDTPPAKEESFLINVTGAEITSSSIKPEFSEILKSEWQAYKSDKPNFTGGLAMQILSPKGDYFIATDMGDNVTNAHHFRIASVTKTFTAAGIMLLNQRGALNIDDKITDNIPGKGVAYIPDTPDYDIPYKNDITIRMLLMHRAGIFDITNNNIPDNEFSHNQPYVGQSYLDYMEEKDKNHTFTFDELVGVNASNQLSFFKPGTAYHYSDTGYSMLGKIIERVSGKSYADFIKDELLVPNGLLDTTLPAAGADQALPEPFIKGYVWMAGESEEVTKSNMSPHVAEGNIATTSKDLIAWCKKLFHGEAGLTRETIDMMEAGIKKDGSPDSSYGLGISYAVGAGYGHAGAHEGYLTLMYYNPDTDTSYVMLTNMWNVENGLESITAEIKAMIAIANKILKKMETDTVRK